MDVGSASSTVIHRISCWTWRRRRRSLRPSSSTSSATMSRSSRRRTLRTIHCSWVVRLLCSPSTVVALSIARSSRSRWASFPPSGARPCWSRRLDEADEVTVPLGEVAHEPGGDDGHALLRLAAAGRGHAAPRVDDEHEVLLPGRHVAAHEGRGVPGRRLPVDVANLVSRHVVTQVVVVEAPPVEDRGELPLEQVARAAPRVHEELALHPRQQRRCHDVPRPVRACGSRPPWRR